MPMREIVLDGADWKNGLDFYDALLASLGAPEWHSRSIDAILDSMIWGGINAVEPPYLVKVLNTVGACDDVRDEVALAKKYLIIGRNEFREQEGVDIEVSLEIVS